MVTSTSSSSNPPNHPRCQEGTLACQEYIEKLASALMEYGAPTHKLEEAIEMSSQCLGIQLETLYIPGCMLISFGAPHIHTKAVKPAGSFLLFDLGKLKEVHDLNKEVMHNCIDIEEATANLDAIMSRPLRYSKWWMVLFAGCASATVGPFAFEARFVDIPILFLLGITLGLNKFHFCENILFRNIFEIWTTCYITWLSRAFSSLAGGNLFCFSSLVQAPIALILPGYPLLASLLELQSKSILAGAVRMIFALVSSLLLGFGMTIGAALWGFNDDNTSVAMSCQQPILPMKSHGFLLNWFAETGFAAFFTLWLCLLCQAHWKQIPMMIVMSLISHTVSFFCDLKFPSSVPIGTTVGAFILGSCGNLYSRFGYDIATAAIVPGLLVRLPAQLAAMSSLLVGLDSTDQITNVTTYENGTSTTYITINDGNESNNLVFNVGYSMIQVAIGVAFGLMLSNCLINSFSWRRRGGVFSF
ncbi:hypothetical protein BJ875DRAFT_458480 [Amylocarpus encephaloides]|uniref:Threonine/serine exporter-like N-terminal domain-containing protein n=1 Tax=Amylocarpus encephaloides TaxID=45428 RepID=A0A9P8C829_9HELO|nr:hypothetical protein BJ875DRAFT_458480 [Amylocarpus encephaloides]